MYKSKLPDLKMNSEYKLSYNATETYITSMIVFKSDNKGEYTIDNILALRESNKNKVLKQLARMLLKKINFFKKNS